MEEKKYKLDNKTFLEWYYSDKDDLVSLGRYVLTSLKANGHYDVKSQDTLDECGYIPKRLLEGFASDTEGEIEDMSEIELINIEDNTHEKCEHCGEITLIHDEVGFCLHCLEAL